MNKLESFFLSLLELCEWLAREICYGFPHNRLVRQEQHKPVILAGNGDSLRKLTETSISTDTDYCLVNFSPLNEFFFKVKPRYHILADNAFFTCTGTEVDDKVRKLQEVLKSVDWDLYLFVPTVYRKAALRRYGINPKIKLQYFTRNSFTQFFLFKKLEYRLFNRGLASPKMMNVGVAALYCLIHSGYKRIHLYGMEHSWMRLIRVDDSNRVCMLDTHYYDKQEPKATIMYQNGRLQKLHEQLNSQSTAFASYWDLKGWAEYMGGIDIVNKTKDSYIDAFRKEID